MGLSGLAIYKLLPKTNCKECGYPTCLAFAMKLAALQAELSACPYVSDDAKASLDAASAPPIRLVTVGNENRKIEVGNETVLYRHEKTFYHQPGLVVSLPDDLSAEEFSARVDQVAGYTVERVGMALTADGVAIKDASGDASTFGARVAQAVEAGLPVVLMNKDPAALEAGLKAAQGHSPLIYAADGENWEALAGLAARYKAPLAVCGDGDLGSLATLADAVCGKGVQDIVLDPGARGWADSLASLTQLRRLALKKGVRSLGYPTITFPGEGAADAREEALLAAQPV